MLLEGLYSKYDPKNKVAALFSWMGNKGFHLYDSIEWGAHDKRSGIMSERQGDNFEFEEDTIQIKFSRDSFHNDKHSSNIMFDEIEHTTALGDLLLANRSVVKCIVRFKLDSGAGANLLPFNVYKKLFPGRKLHGTVDKQVQLIAANKTRIK